MKTDEGSLSVFTLYEGTFPSPWLAHRRARVMPPAGAAMIDRIGWGEGPFLLDLIGRPPIPGSVGVIPIEQVFKANGTILADPWESSSDPGWFTLKNIADSRVAVFAPFIYRPAMLEIRRLLEARVLGDLSGIELSASISLRAVDILYAAAHLFGPPSGHRTGDRDRAQPVFEAFLWYSNFACSAKLLSTMPAGQLEIKAACRRGMIRAAPEDPVLQVFPAGKEAYTLPLPDGDGIYYNLLDVIDTVLSPSTGPAFTPRETAEAVRWVEECVNERPSLLL